MDEVCDWKEPLPDLGWYEPQRIFDGSIGLASTEHLEASECVRAHTRERASERTNGRADERAKRTTNDGNNEIAVGNYRKTEERRGSESACVRARPKARKTGSRRLCQCGHAPS